MREFLRKLVLLAMVGALGYGGYHLYRQGTFRRGLGPAVASVLQKVPYFGSRFKHYSPFTSYRKATTSPKKYIARHGGKKKHHTRHRRSSRRGRR